MLKKFLRNFSIYNDISLYIFNKKWRKLNKNNYTKANNRFDINKVQVGKFTYGELNIKSFGNENEKLEIGNFCSIAQNVTFLLSGEHQYNTILTYPFRKKIFNINESLSKGDIIIEDDVWIGYGSIILSGVKIGKGSIVGAGSVVAKDIPPYAIYVNNQIKKYRFDKEIIDKLVNLDFSSLDEKFIKENIQLLYEECNEKNLDFLIKKIEEE